MFQCVYIYPALHSNSYCCEVLINKIRKVKYPIMTQLKKKKNTLHSRPCLLSWQTAANRPIKAGMVCFGAWQDTKTPGSDKGGYELYCENPRCQDILHARRWREKKYTHTEHGTRTLYFCFPIYDIYYQQTPRVDKPSFCDPQSRKHCVPIAWLGSSHSYGYKITRRCVTSHKFPRATDFSFCYNSHTAN